MNGEAGINVRKERCADCLFSGVHDNETVRKLLAKVAENDSYVQCHCHNPAAMVVCRGYFDAYGERGGTPIQLAIRFERLGYDVINWVEADELARDEEQEALLEYTGPEWE